MFLDHAHVPRWLNVAIFDLGNVLLLAGILLFPHGNLSWRRLLAIALVAGPDVAPRNPVPSLLHLRHDRGRPVAAPLPTFHRFQRTTAAVPLGPARHQRLCRAALPLDRRRQLQMVGKQFRTSAACRTEAGISFALAVLVLQFGLLVALVRYRLYDAEFVISKSANIALITRWRRGGVRGYRRWAEADHLQLLRKHRQRRAGHLRRGAFNGARQPDPGACSALVGTAFPDATCSCFATTCPKSRATCGRRLPSATCSTRSSPASIAASARCVALLIVNGCVLRARGLSIDEVEAWRTSTFAQDYKRDMCEPSDKLFPIRVHLVPSSDKDEEPIGYLLVGPRPDGSIPSRDEQKALKEVSELIARAIRTVIKREAREAQVAELIAVERPSASRLWRRCWPSHRR